MGCSTTHVKINGKLFKQENIELDINTHYKNKELTQAQALITLITKIRNKIIYEYDNLIYISGACLFKNPNMAHIVKCILVKICTESEGNLNNLKINFKEEPPFMKIEKEFSEYTNSLLSKLFEFVVKLRDYKIILNQIDKETPKLMYIIFENNNKISKENLDKINKSILLFKDLNELRHNLLKEYRDDIYELFSKNESYIELINKIGEKALKKNLKDIYEITMLFKEYNDLSEINIKEEDWEMYSNIKEAKKILEKKLQREKVEEIDTFLFSKNNSTNASLNQDNIILNNNMSS